MKKRIVIFSVAYHPFIGGAEIALREITRRIPHDEYEFDLITLRFDSRLPETEVIDGVTVHRIGFTKEKPTMKDLVEAPLVFNKFLFPLKAKKKALELHRKQPYDAAWSMMAAFAGYAGVLFKLRMKEIPFIVTLQEGDPIDEIKRKVGITYPLFKKIFTRASIIQVISEYLGAFAQDMGYEKKPVVIPNGVDIARFSDQKLKEKRSNIRDSLRISQGATILVTVSRLVKKNGVADVIKALEQLDRSVHFLIIGTGPDEYQLRDVAKRLGLQSRVHFAGEVSNDRIPEYLHASDIFIRPSLSEGQGISFIEAMAARLPVIATPVGGIVDFIFDREAEPQTGYLCGVEDPESIVGQVERIMSDPNRDEVIARAYTLVKEKYQWDTIAERMKKEVFDATLQ